MKITKSAISKFIKWSSSRYNDYLGYGNKKENVQIVYESLIAGYRRAWNKEYPDENTFIIKCASGTGENIHGRHWRLKGILTDWEYEIDCVNKTVRGIQSGRILSFNPQTK